MGMYQVVTALDQFLILGFFLRFHHFRRLVRHFMVIYSTNDSLQPIAMTPLSPSTQALTPEKCINECHQQLQQQHEQQQIPYTGHGAILINLNTNAPINPSSPPSSYAGKVWECYCVASSSSELYLNDNQQEIIIRPDPRDNETCSLTCSDGLRLCGDLSGEWSSIYQVCIICTSHTYPANR
jgi:hypothetical protein